MVQYTQLPSPGAMGGSGNMLAANQQMLDQATGALENIFMALKEKRKMKVYNKLMESPFSNDNYKKAQAISPEIGNMYLKTHQNIMAMEQAMKAGERQDLVDQIEMDNFRNSETLDLVDVLRRTPEQDRMRMFDQFMQGADPQNEIEQGAIGAINMWVMKESAGPGGGNMMPDFSDERLDTFMMTLKPYAQRVKEDTARFTAAREDAIAALERSQKVADREDEQQHDLAKISAQADANLRVAGGSPTDQMQMYDFATAQAAQAGLSPGTIEFNQYRDAVLHRMSNVQGSENQQLIPELAPPMPLHQGQGYVDPGQGQGGQAQDSGQSTNIQMIDMLPGAGNTGGNETAEAVPVSPTQPTPFTAANNTPPAPPPAVQPRGRGPAQPVQTQGSPAIRNPRASRVTPQDALGSKNPFESIADHVKETKGATQASARGRQAPQPKRTPYERARDKVAKQSARGNVVPKGSVEVSLIPPENKKTIVDKVISGLESVTTPAQASLPKEATIEAPATETEVTRNKAMAFLTRNKLITKSQDGTFVSKELADAIDEQIVKNTSANKVNMNLDQTLDAIQTGVENGKITLRQKTDGSIEFVGKNKGKDVVFLRVGA